MTGWRCLGGEVDLRSLGLFRIGLGVVLLVDLVFSKLWYFNEFFSNEHPFLPTKSMLETPSFYSFIRLVLCVHVLAAVCFTLGLQTFAANVVCYIATAQLNVHNPFILHNGDIIQVQLLFWSLFLPVGASFSLDNRLSQRPRQSQTARSYLGAGAIGLRVQVACLYIFSTWFKTGTTWTHDYTATELAMQIPYYQTFVGEFVLTNLPIDLLRAMTWLVLRWEGFAPYLLWLLPCTAALCSLLHCPRPLERRLITCASAIQLLTVVSGMCLHIGLGACLRLGQFWVIGVVLWFPFVPSGCWRVQQHDNGQEQANERKTSSSAAPTLTASSGTNALALAFTVLILVANVTSTTNTAVDTPIESAINFFSLMQKWNMFAPNPPQTSWHHTVIGRVSSNNTVAMLFDPWDLQSHDARCRGYESHAWYKLWEGSLHSPHAPTLRHSITKSFCAAAIAQGLDAVALSVYYTKHFPDPQKNPPALDPLASLLTPWIKCPTTQKTGWIQ